MAMLNEDDKKMGDFKHHFTFSCVSFVKFWIYSPGPDYKVVKLYDNLIVSPIHWLVQQTQIVIRLQFLC